MYRTFRPEERPVRQKVYQLAPVNSPVVSRFKTGDRVRIDIPDQEDPDYERFHGCSGTIRSVFEDAAGELSGDERDNYLYQVELDSGETAEFRWRDLRPAPQSPD